MGPEDDGGAWLHVWMFLFYTAQTSILTARCFCFPWGLEISFRFIFLPLFGFASWLPSVTFLQFEGEPSHTQSQVASPNNTCSASRWHEKHLKKCLRVVASRGGKCGAGKRHAVLEKVCRSPDHSGLWWRDREGDVPQVTQQSWGSRPSLLGSVLTPAQSSLYRCSWRRVLTC